MAHFTFLFAYLGLVLIIRSLEGPVSVACLFMYTIAWMHGIWSLVSCEGTILSTLNTNVELQIGRMLYAPPKDGSRGEIGGMHPPTSPNHVHYTHVLHTLHSVTNLNSRDKVIKLNLIWYVCNKFYPVVITKLLGYPQTQAGSSCYCIKCHVSVWCSSYSRTPTPRLAGCT